MDVQLTIEINYKEQKYPMRVKNHLKLENIIKRTIDYFNINKSDEKYVYLYYKDDEGDMIKIQTIEDIYISSKDENNSKNMISTVYLDISKEKVSNSVNESNNNVNSELNNKYTDEKKEEQKYLEIIKEKDFKIKQLEEKMGKLKKEYKEELNILKLENSKLKEINKKENNLKNNDMIQIENKLSEIFNDELNKFLEELKSIKNNIYYDLKEKQNNNKNEKYNKIKSYIQNINKNLSDNKNKLNNINDAITNIKDQMNKIEINKEKNNNNNQNIKNQLKFGNEYTNNLPQLINVNKPYNCLNCNNIFFLNKCFNSKENNQYKEHSLKLKNSFHDNGNENKTVNNNIKFNNDILNKKNEGYINKDIKNEKIKNKTVIEKKNIINIDKVKDKKFELAIIQEDQELDDILNNYFYNEKGELKDTQYDYQEMRTIKEFYKSLLKNNKTLEYIEEYQNKFINIIINPFLEGLKENDKLKRHINNRSYHLRLLINKLKSEK